jgi:hypothetical protein
LRAFEKRVLRRIVGPKREMKRQDVDGNCKMKGM